MCRALAYLGPPLRLSALLLEPDNALIKQIDPKQLRTLNLAGFGMMAWVDDPSDNNPLTYRSTTIPIYDENLASLSRKLSASTVLAHVRGIPYRADAGFGSHNLHPFRYDGFSIALAHNGDLTGFSVIRVPLVASIRSDIAVHIRGTTDSEYVYALLLSQLEDPNAPQSVDAIVNAVRRTIQVLRKTRSALGIDTHSALNLFISGQDRLVALRFAFDYGCYPLDPSHLSEVSEPYMGLWYTAGSEFRIERGAWKMVGGSGQASAVLVASEPVTLDLTGWVEVPEYAALAVERIDGRVSARTIRVDD